MDDFVTKVGAWCDKAEGYAREAFIAIAWDALTRVKELTPVRTGWLRSNWQAVTEDSDLPVERREGVKSTTEIAAGILAGLGGGIAAGAAGTATGGPIAGFAASVAGGVAAQEGAEAFVRRLETPELKSFTQARLGEKIRIVNPVRYARSIEAGRQVERADGSVTHVPGRGMVAQTVSEIPTIAQRAVNRVIGRR
jgi:outer membrane lipoprotein SlyB